MAIGFSIFLIAVGAIMAFALDRDFIRALDVNLVGYILMAVGALGLIVSLVINAQRSRTQHRTVVDDRRPPPNQPYQEPPARY